MFKQYGDAASGRLYNLRGCRVSEPIVHPWGGGCRIVEWIDEEGRLARRVVSEDVTEAEVAAAIRQPTEGRRHLMDDDEQLPRDTLPRR